MELSGAYTVEEIEVAAGGEVISLIGGSNNDTGTASFEFEGGTGQYKVIITAFDEDDGKGQINLEQNDTQIGAFTLDRELGSHLATAQTMTTLEIDDVYISAGDIFTIEGFEEGSEVTRIDSIEFVPISY